MIGEDGTIYEGRGWTMDADRPMELSHITGRCLDIAYIGDYYSKYETINKLFNTRVNKFK